MVATLVYVISALSTVTSRMVERAAVSSGGMLMADVLAGKRTVMSATTDPCESCMLTSSLLTPTYDAMLFLRES